ncbi:MAG: manganese efflux pump [Clostridia bacterium]|nr:manganese efflux pump [Clostridia bacterium]
MSFYLVFITALALSMDAFAVSISCGVSNSAKKTSDKFKLAIAFGFFQGLMPTLGYFMSSLFRKSVDQYSGIIAFVILLLIGAHMIKESFKIKEECDVIQLTIKKILLLAIATSIDAFAAGISFSMLDINIFWVAFQIMIVTFAVSYLGILFGCKIKTFFRKGAEILGGSILILIGLKILIESL